MITTVNYNGEECVAVILDDMISPLDAQIYRKSLVSMFEESVCCEHTKERISSESFFFINALIKKFSTTEKGGEV